MHALRLIIAVLMALVSTISLAQTKPPAIAEMVRIPEGTFRMGGLGEDPADDELPVRKVKVQAFYLGSTEVTWAQYQPCIDAGVCPDNSEDGGDNTWGKADRPVIEVSWSDVHIYLSWLNEQTGKHFRLPTEAEWEYAARAGTVSAYSWGDAIGRNLANCYGCGSTWDNRQTAPVGSFAPNAFGLHDMHGNVWELVADCYKPNYRKVPRDGRAYVSEDCEAYVRRGGSWAIFALGLESSYRSYVEPHVRNAAQGFRLAHDLKGF